MDAPYGYCGMPCALCTRFRTEGKSRCPGCSADGYYTDVCKVHHCCRDKALRHCGACPDVPCARLGKMGDFRDLNTGNVKQRTCAEIATGGFDAWHGSYTQKAELLTTALARYNDGRMKRYLCELFLQRELAELSDIMRRAEATISGAPKEAGRALRALVDEAPLLRDFTKEDLPLLARWLCAPHVNRWYHEPEDWLAEAAGRYPWIRHFIVELRGRSIGFCQFYEYRLSGEAWHGSAEIAGAYSIDYLIGEPAYLSRGYGRQMVLALLEKIRQLPNAARIIVQPEPENAASCALLRSCGFCLDEENAIYYYELSGREISAENTANRFQKNRR